MVSPKDLFKQNEYDKQLAEQEALKKQKKKLPFKIRKLYVVILPLIILALIAMFVLPNIVGNTTEDSTIKEDIVVIRNINETQKVYEGSVARTDDRTFNEFGFRFTAVGREQGHSIISVEPTSTGAPVLIEIDNGNHKVIGSYKLNQCLGCIITEARRFRDQSYAFVIKDKGFYIVDVRGVERLSVTGVVSFDTTVRGYLLATKRTVTLIEPNKGYELSKYTVPPELGNITRVRNIGNNGLFAYITTDKFKGLIKLSLDPSGTQDVSVIASIGELILNNPIDFKELVGTGFVVAESTSVKIITYNGELKETLQTGYQVGSINLINQNLIQVLDLDNNRVELYNRDRGDVVLTIQGEGGKIAAASYTE